MLMGEDALELQLELRSSALEIKGKKNRFFYVRSLNKLLLYSHILSCSLTLSYLQLRL